MSDPFTSGVRPAIKVLIVRLQVINRSGRLEKDRQFDFNLKEDRQKFHQMVWIAMKSGHEVRAFPKNAR